MIVTKNALRIRSLGAVRGVSSRWALTASIPSHSRMAAESSVFKSIVAQDAPQTTRAVVVPKATGRLRETGQDRNTTR